MLNLSNLHEVKSQNGLFHTAATFLVRQSQNVTFLLRQNVNFMVRQNGTFLLRQNVTFLVRQNGTFLVRQNVTSRTEKL